MLTRKATMLVLACAVLAGAGYAGKRYFASKKQELPPAPVFTGHEPKLPESPPLLAMDEASAELTRIVKRDPKSNKVDSIEVGYKDGRSGLYLFREGKLRSYKGFDEHKLLKYQANYEPNGLIADYRFVRSDGSVETQYRRLPDGSEELLFLDGHGFCIKSVVTARDGSQTVSTRPDASKPAEVVVTRAEPSEKNFSPIRLADGSESHRLKVKLVGVRVNSWEYRDANGAILHSGKYAENGDVEILLYNPAAKPVAKQVWTCVGEDWSRRIYNLARIERLSEEGGAQLTIMLYPDGRTPMEVHNFSWGYKNSIEYFDKNGFHTRTEYYDSNGSPTTTHELPVQYRPQAKLPPQIIAAPGDASGAHYRLNGAPYALPVPEQGYELNPLFVMPK